MDFTTSVVLGVIFGSFGMGYLVYGKKQRNGIAFLSGFALCLFPYFVNNIYLYILIGVVLLIAPFAIRF